MKSRGFSLIELLVVIAIIAILVAMLTPLILQVKETSKVRVCVSNMRQLGQAILNYIEDNSGYGLPQNTPTAVRNPWVLSVEPLLPNYIPGSPQMLRSYIRSLNGNKIVPHPKHIWVCSGDLFRGAGEESMEPYWWNCGSSYMYPGPEAYCHSPSAGMYSRDRVTPRKPFAWRNPKRNILIADYWYDFHSGGQRVDHKMIGDITPDMWRDIRQLKSTNALFLDMHVRALTPGERDLCVRYVRIDDNPHYSPP